MDDGTTEATAGAWCVTCERDVLPHGGRVIARDAGSVTFVTRTGGTLVTRTEHERIARHPSTRTALG